MAWVAHLQRNEDGLSPIEGTACLSTAMVLWSRGDGIMLIARSDPERGRQLVKMEIIQPDKDKRNE